MTRNVGKYQIIRQLATGGMAEVFLAKATGPRGFEKTLVLKCILPQLANEPAFVEMFLFEAMLAARLTHPHIVQLFDLGEADGSYFLAMEYVDGPSLRALIKRASAQGLLLPPTLCARLISHACEGLAFAHDFVDADTGQPLELIHRDISPDNILLSLQGAVKVGDFGIAKAAGQVHKTKSGVIKGKISYMPPEQLRAQDMDRRADVYALGVVLYELLTLRKPYRASSEPGLMHSILFESPVPARQHRPDLPEAMQRILARAIAKDREQRYPDCHALQADLEDFILAMGKPVTARQVSQFIHQVLSGPGGLAPSSPPLPSVEPAPVSTRVQPPPAPEASKTVWPVLGSASSQEAATCSQDMMVPEDWPLPRSSPSMSDPTLIPHQMVRVEPGAASSEEAATRSEDMMAPEDWPLPRSSPSMSDPMLIPTQTGSSARLSAWMRTAVPGGVALSLLGGLAIWASTARELPERELLVASLPAPPVATAPPPAPSAPAIPPVRQEPEADIPRDVEPPQPIDAEPLPAAVSPSPPSTRRSLEPKPRPPKSPVAPPAPRQPAVAAEGRSAPKQSAVAAEGRSAPKTRAMDGIRPAPKQPAAMAEGGSAPKPLVTVDVVHSATKPPTAMGRLDIRSNPPVRVTVDGVSIGETPLERELELSPGVHNLIFTSKFFRESVKKQVTIKAGETYRLKLVFVRMH